MPALTVSPPHARLTLSEAARLHRIGYSTLRKRVSDGSLPSQRVGRRIFVRPEHLDAMSTPVVGRPSADRAVESAISRVVEAAPRLTEAQRERLAVILGAAA
ncbi:DNA binding domain-containing protein, excisionase family [Microbacterium testaceum StLB037]|uniref:DNA binding domain-containing protein, excisionase family n=1 Tax=Microbacterium testaceum (strain StLB037) TaxID=979556 RepID=A0A1H0Q8W2_MICTS|nr:DNA binding domain-containing protein, excisionase family [Microbacterium testaceum StLB037]